ncbi:MAG TPA: hypothetical protein VHS33_11500 [Sphingomicrobium sp.]|nr:hypothetical protein [Sphingomicrobium sp.]
MAIAVLGLSTLALGACQRQQQKAQDQNIAIDEGIPDNQIAENADIETLPADESSATPSNQLQNGFDNPDVNDIGNSAGSR